ncbi:MAG: preprotein translocase subunit SecA [Candidatus Liptonbacteria bacterium]|nr:preprotein translocase subunit SecA [Candidatus Liptonbacteria bacterium]
MSILKTIFGDSNDRYIKSLKPAIDEINDLEEKFKEFSDSELRALTDGFKNRLKEGETLDDILVEAFAAVREVAKRTLSQRPFDVQLMGGIVLHRGAVAEMVTGEGKTLAAVAPAYLNALAGEGAHIVTVNEYLARRDAVWMGQIYRALGLSVACLVPNAAFAYDPSYTQINADADADKRGYISENQRENLRESALLDRERDSTGGFLIQQEFLRPVSRREAYLSDIVYGTNHEFGFDYLRDNLAYSFEDQVQSAQINADIEIHADQRRYNISENPRLDQRKSAHYYAIIDEVDSILIDEARTPLIISAPDAESSEFYKTFSRIVERLQPEEDYKVDEKFRTVSINDSGIEKVEKIIGIQNLYAPENLRLVHFLEECLKAKTLFRRDKDYVVKNGEVIIVDEFTGRMLQGRRYNAGLHQAIEAKEGVFVKEESRTYAKISIQNYFRIYKKIAGMTGTAQTSAEEFHKVYNLEVVSIPTNRKLVREQLPDVIYKTAGAKWDAVVKEIEALHRRGQPVLVGTTSIEKNERVSEKLHRAGIPHEVLNAKNNEHEGAIIAQAGRPNAVTVATNMAGRGVDIILGGNPPSPGEAEKIRGLGGLHVIGTERHEARRIDNQLRGRAGRQGDPGSAQFFLSLEDDLLRIFGGDRIKNMMETFNLPEDQPIQASFLSKVIGQAQAKVEGFNFDLRKRLLEYDDVLNKQRTSIYKRRQEILESMNREDVVKFIFDASSEYLNVLASVAKQSPEIAAAEGLAMTRKAFEEAGIVDKNHPYPEDDSQENLIELLHARSGEAAADPFSRNRLLSILDLLWMNQLDDLEALSESVGLRAYGQKDPIVEYRHEARRLFKDFWNNFNGWVFMNIFKLATSDKRQATSSQISTPPVLHVANSHVAKVGRNDPCPCGAVNPATDQIYKYKKCGLINASYHKK